MIDFLAKPNEMDIAYGWIMTLLPGSAADSTATAGYGVALATLTGALTFLASLFVAWHVVVGIVSSAYSGKVLGERYHQIWAPLRVVLGFGMMVPISGGFSSVHYLLRDVVGPAAVNIGNAPIVAYIDHLAKGGEINVAALQGRLLANDVLDREICVAVQHAVYDNMVLAGWQGYQKAPSPKPEGVSPINDQTRIDWNYGSCGNLSFSLPGGNAGIPGGEAKLEKFHEDRAAATKKMVDSIRGALYGPAPKYERKKLFGDYFAKKDFGDGSSSYDHAHALIDQSIVPADIMSVVTNAGYQWDADIAKAAKEVYSDAKGQDYKKELRQRIETYGFMAAGSYERELSKLSGGMSALANTTPAKVDPNPGSAFEEQFRAAQGLVRQVASLNADKVADGTMIVPGTSANALDQFLANTIPNIASMKLNVESHDPVGDMITMGHTLLAIATTSIATMLVAKGVAGWGGGAIGSLTGAKGAAVAIMDYLGQWVGYLIMTFLLVGIMHSFVLPMIPMMMVFLMGVSWLILFLEASIACVLWAFAFIRMDGQEFFDRNQSPGATLVFNLFLRPALGMLAFIGSLLLLPELLRALTLLWDQSFYQQTGNNGWLLFVVQWAVGIIMFTWLQWTLTIRMFGLIPTIADRVGHWMGFGQGHGYGDGSETTSAITTMGAAAGAVAKAPILPGGGKGGGGGGGGGKGGLPSNLDVLGTDGTGSSKGAPGTDGSGERRKKKVK